MNVEGFLESTGLHVSNALRMSIVTILHFDISWIKVLKYFEKLKNAGKNGNILDTMAL